ncbi:MAG: sialate O-acetylesterase [Cyclobacteriaceae bacterium]
MKKIINLPFLLIVLILFPILVHGQTKLPSFFASNMVLQQNEQVAIWGMDNSKTSILVEGNWGESATATSDKEGNWKVKLKTPSAGGPFELQIVGSDTVVLENVLIGEVWLCSGQSNMEMPMKGFNNQPINGSNEAILNSENDQIRYFGAKRASSLSPETDIEGSWSLTDPSTTGEFSATAYFFARKLNEIMEVPVGIMVTSWGGSSVEAWMDEETLKKYNDIEIPNALPEKSHQRTPTLLYNAMISPFIGFTIKGTIWYQGESNRNNPEAYKKLFPDMISLWRLKWGQGDFPFYFVQIAPYGYDGSNSAFLREAQLHAMNTVPNTGMAVTMDIGDCGYIHPREKRLVGERLVYWALAKAYDINGLAYSGPLYKSMEVNDGKVLLTFDYVKNGLSSFGMEITGFQIAGEDKMFYPAMAIINRNKSLTVWSSEVENPVAVRYAFDNCTPGSLYNIEALPASSFRTDDWEE